MYFSCTRVWNVAARASISLSAVSGFQHHPHSVPAATPQTVLLPPVPAQEGNFLRHTLLSRFVSACAFCVGNVCVCFRHQINQSCRVMEQLCLWRSSCVHCLCQRLQTLLPNPQSPLTAAASSRICLKKPVRAQR